MSLPEAPSDPFASAKDTISSWDKCMAKTYCKWPVIVAIIVGSVILLTVIFCVARCICCGAEIACCCVKCCTCCCPSGRGRKRVHSAPPPPVYAQPSYKPDASGRIYEERPVHQQYHSHTAPAFAAPEPERPQYAKFESQSKPVNEDALPAMPVWSEAKSTRVEEEVIPEKRGDVELSRLDTTGVAAGAAMAAPRRSPVHRSPTGDGYASPVGYQNDSFVNQAPRRSPGPYAGGYEPDNRYRDVSPVHQQSLSPVYGAGAGYQNDYQGRRSPNAAYGQAYDQAYDPAPRYTSPTPQESSGYGYAVPSQNRPLEMPYHSAHQAPSPVSSPTHYAPSGSTRYEPPAASYPGQQEYQAAEPSYPGQSTYHAYQPAQAQGDQYTGVSRKPVQGSWKEL
ncbi:hypothetical protein M011DRAFT_527360 [Sporormia fimetaria CBS 119925]|uniref:Fibroin-3 related protein n=1 Tax=Sporormia fimetaria CBS 119925 TaxID=1340428 RepID=A0A6A6V9J3_9PLEO|nr:hypothetical protein M011DRAFT_527360 [Sporormia fimetaria CBS 119925]